MSGIGDYIDTFDLLGDWDARYAYLIELGEQLPPMPEAMKVKENQVQGCMSTVHVVATPHADSAERIQYVGDCDTAIIKGVVAIMIDLYSGKTPAEIQDTDVEALFEGLKLHEHLSPNRHFGIYALVEKMKEAAAAYHPPA